jgi:peptidoglycan/xylan/chitin deacetylase (PgdA/CDA1 family)
MTTNKPSGFGARRLTKHLAESLMASLPHRYGRSASLVLAYHNVVASHEAGRGDASLHLEQDMFARQMRLAKRVADVVDLPTLIREHRRSGRRIAVTFDDAYRGATTLGVPVCAAHGVVPTVFVSPGLYGSTPPWDRYSEAGGWSESARTSFLVDQRGMNNTPKCYDPALPHSYSIAEADELHQALRKHTFHVGNHSFSHANLGALTTESLRSELERSVTCLAEFGNAVVPFVAYPYGIAPRSNVETTLSGLCDAAFIVSGGWTKKDDDFSRLHWPRLNIPAGLSLRGFAARLNGWA